MQSKTVVITGTSSGIGKETAKFFAEKRWNVAATMRTPKKEKELKELKNIKVYELDVTKQETIDKAYKDIINDYKKVDVLVNNAGYALNGPFETTTDEQIRSQFDVNVFGLFDVTRTFLGHFRQNQDGIIINISSMGGKITYPLISVYHSSKFAIEGFSESISYELAEFGIKVKIVEPGNIATEFGTRSKEFIQSDTVKDYDPFFEQFIKKFESAGPELYSHPHMVAEVIYRAATDGTDRLRYIAGDDAKRLISLKHDEGDEAFMSMIKKSYTHNQSFFNS